MKSKADDPVLFWNLICGYIEFTREIAPPWDNELIEFIRIPWGFRTTYAVSGRHGLAVEEIALKKYGWKWMGRDGIHLGYRGLFGWGWNHFVYGQFRTFAFDTMDFPYEINAPLFDDYGNLRWL